MLGCILLAVAEEGCVGRSYEAVVRINGLRILKRAGGIEVERRCIGERDGCAVEHSLQLVACHSYRIAVDIHTLGVEVACYLECKTVVVGIAQILYIQLNGCKDMNKS